MQVLVVGDLAAGDDALDAAGRPRADLRRVLNVVAELPDAEVVDLLTWAAVELDFDTFLLSAPADRLDWIAEELAPAVRSAVAASGE